MNKFLTLMASCLLASTVLALPEDENQEVIIDGGSLEFDLDSGLVVLHGSPDDPIVITQGSLKITGLDVTVKRVDGAIHKVTVTGEPARLQQQPEIDQSIVYASGLEITFNNTEQLVTIEKEAEFIQDGNTMTGCYMDYHLTSRKVNINTCNDGDRLRVIIPPGQDQ